MSSTSATQTAGSYGRPDVEIGLLGPMVIQADGCDLCLTAAKERAVLALLAMRSGRVVSVSEIVRALWGEEEPKTAVKAIQMLISRLRRVLPSGTIETVSPGYRAVIDPRNVDALRFEELLQSTYASQGHEVDAKTLSAALELWRGPALLDLSGNDLGRNEATRLWELRLTAEEQRLDALLACGQHGQLVAELMAAVDSEPLRERRWALLMRGLYRCGRQAEALRTFQRLREYLATELGVEPSAELSALELSILQGDPELAWTAAAGTIAATTHADPTERVVVNSPLPLTKRLNVPPDVGLIGRTVELETIEDALKRVATDHQARLVLVNGEAGSGKTALLGAAARDATECGAYVLFGHCEEDLAVPYQLFSESLSHYFAHAAREQFSGYVAEHSSELSRLAPTLERVAPSGSSSGVANADARRAILFNEVVGLMATISQHQPVVLVFDDLQWADPASLQLLRHLLSAEQPMRVLVLCGYRNGGPLQSAPLLETLGLLRRHEGVDRIEIKGLEIDGVVSYMEVAAGHTLDAPLLRFAHDIFLETDGNPFFVGEVLRHLVEIGTIRRDETGCWTAIDSIERSSLPQSVSEVIGARVVRLGQFASSILSIAATVGRDFDLELLTRASSTSEEEVLNILDASKAVSLVRELAGPPGQFSFVHALIQHTLYEDLGPTRKALAHERVAQALEGVLGDTPAERFGELARHWFSTGRMSDRPKALHYAHKAADAALADLAPADALRYYTQALDICATVEDVDAGITVDLAIGLGISQQATGNPEIPRNAAQRCSQGRRDRGYGSPCHGRLGSRTSVGHGRCHQHGEG